MAEDRFKALDELYGTGPSEEEDRYGQIDQLYNSAGQDTTSFDQPDLPEPEPIDKQADELGSRYYEGMSFEDAVAEYNRLESLPNVQKEAFSGNLVYTDTVSGRKEFIPPPSPRMIKAAGQALYKAVQAPFSEDVTLQDAADAFTNPEASVSGVKLFEMGLRESAGDAAQTAAALAGQDELVERIDEATPRIDTDDSFWDSAIADGGPALAAALVGDKGITAVGNAIARGAPILSKLTPGFVKSLGRLASDEALAVSTLGTEEGTFIVGQDAAVPVWQGLNLEDGASNDVIEQRVNALTEGLMLSSMLSGAGRTTADAGQFVYDMTVRPLYTAFGPKAGKEQIIYNDIMDQIIGDSVDLSDPEQRFQVAQRIARIVDQNSETLLPHLDDLNQSTPVELDTLNALLRGELDGPTSVNVRKLIAEAQTKGRPNFTTKVAEPKQRLDAEIQAYLEGLDAETPGQQTAAMQDVADEFADQANTFVDQADANATRLEQEYNASLERIGSGISEDLEFAGRLRRLEEITGTDIVREKDAALADIMQGVRDGFEDLNNQKNILYSAIEGGSIDTDGIFKKLYELNDDQISAALTQVRRSSPISNMLEIINTKKVPDIDPDTGADIMREPTLDERKQLFADLLTNQQADFGYFYTTIRPELSALASNLYDADNAGAGKVVRDLVRYIDNDMVDFVAKSDAPLADAAKEAKKFYQDSYAPIFGGQGVMADYADLYNSTIGRTDQTNLMSGVTTREFDEAGYNQGLQRMTKGVFSSGIPADAEQMFAALEVASDPDAMADYMILDVLDRYATEVRLNGLDAANLTGMSKDLQQYATQLNDLFPAKAAQITKFVSQIEEAARNKGNLEAVLTDVGTQVKGARDEVAQTELMGFLRQELGNDRFLPTSNPQTAFNQLFNSKESVAAIENINLALEAMPAERQAIVRRGLEVAYTRQFKQKISDLRQEVSGQTPLKESALTKSQQEFDQLLVAGREVFKGKPEIMDALEGYADLAGFVQRNRNARSNVSNSNTAFLQEATTATNRLIFTFIGPLSRPGTRVRAAVSAGLQKVAPDQRANEILDKILSDPDYFVELSRKYNRAPRDKESEDLLTRFLVGTTVKVRSATDEEDVPMGVDATMDAAAGVVDTNVGRIQTGIDYLDQQMNGAFSE